jgi:hypothetical protein
MKTNRISHDQDGSQRSVLCPDFFRVFRSELDSLVALFLSYDSNSLKVYLYHSLITLWPSILPSF